MPHIPEQTPPRVPGETRKAYAAWLAREGYLQPADPAEPGDPGKIEVSPIYGDERFHPFSFFGWSADEARQGEYMLAGFMAVAAVVILPFTALMIPAWLLGRLIAWRVR